MFSSVWLNLQPYRCSKDDQALFEFCVSQAAYKLLYKVQNHSYFLGLNVTLVELRNGNPWVLNFPPCRGHGGSVPTGNVASLVSSNCPLWEERRGNTTRLPWVATRKSERRILEIEGHPRDLQVSQHISLASDSV